MDAFALRAHLVEFGSNIRSFIRIADERIRDLVDLAQADGLLWPDPLIPLAPSFETGRTIDELVDKGLLHNEYLRSLQTTAHRGDTGRSLEFRTRLVLPFTEPRVAHLDKEVAS